MAATENREIQELLHYCKNVPIQALRQSAKTKIASYLDLEATLIEDYTNNWIGLAEIIGYGNAETNMFERSCKPTIALLDHWATRPHLSPTIDMLFQYLLEIQRPDVILDCYVNIKRDVDAFELSQKTEQQPTSKNIFLECDEPKRYDAFVVFRDNQKDTQFVIEAIKILEEQHYITLFIPGRDDLAGTERYVLTADMIANRCRKVLLMMSKDFRESEYCDFALKFSHSLSPGAKSRRVIPIMLDDIELPSILKHVGKVDYFNKAQREWVWDRIAKVIKTPLVPNKEDWQCTIDDLKNMKYNTKAASHMLYSLGMVARIQSTEEEDESTKTKSKKKKK